MDKSIVHLKAVETLKAILVLLLMLACLAFAGTIDHDEEVRHERWMAHLEEEGAWVLR